MDNSQSLPRDITNHSKIKKINARFSDNSVALDPTVVGATIKGLDQKDKLTGLDQVEINLIYNNGVKHHVWSGPDTIQEFAAPGSVQPKLLNLTGKTATQAHALIEDYALKK